MENYDDEKLADNFEQMARAYSKSLKDKGFVFVKLQEEEFGLLIDEISVIFAKIKACFEKLEGYLDCNVIKNLTYQNENDFKEKFGVTKTYLFKNISSSNDSFLSLISLENLLTLKLMILSIKSGELEFCHSIITKRTRIYAQSFQVEGFVLK